MNTKGQKALTQHGPRVRVTDTAGVFSLSFLQFSLYFKNFSNFRILSDFYVNLENKKINLFLSFPADSAIRLSIFAFQNVRELKIELAKATTIRFSIKKSENC